MLRPKQRWRAGGVVKPVEPGTRWAIRMPDGSWSKRERPDSGTVSARHERAEFTDIDSALACLHEWRSIERFSEAGDEKPRNAYRLVRLPPPRAKCGQAEGAGARAGRCPTAIDLQIQSLRGLGPGWFDAESSPLSDEGLTWLSSLLVPFLPGFELPTPYLYPTPEGHVRAEWSARHWDVYAEFDVTKHAVEVLASRADSDEVGARQLALGVPGAEAQLGRFLADHMK